LFKELLGAARDHKRLRTIATIFIRYGFADVVQRMGLGERLESLGERLNWSEVEDIASLKPPQRGRRALEDLGPTFIKLGQVLSTRVDIFPPEWIVEFERLQDSVPPEPFDKLREQVEADLGASPHDVFATFDETPLGAASIAQVHGAELTDGTAVVVKIRRPGIREVVDADLRLMQRLADAANELPDVGRYRLPDLVRQFRRSILMELNLATESRNAERLQANLHRRYGADDCPAVVPRVFWDYTGERINVQERIVGVPGRDMEGLERAGLDRVALARNGARVVLATILEDGYFHADPHPGNLFFLKDNRIAFIDFGMVGYLSERRREQFVNLLYGIVEHDEENVADMLLELSASADSRREGLIEDVGTFLRQYHGVELEHLDLGSVIRDLLALLRDNQLTLQPELAQTLKVFITLEGLGRRLNPDFNLVDESAPIVRRAFASFYSPKTLARRGRKGVIDSLRLLTQMPRELRDALRALGSGNLQLRIELTELDDLVERLDRAASRLTVGLITSALIIGTAIVMTVDAGPRLMGLPLFGALGFIAAGVGGTWVLISILRGR
jgi:ubiquinone biosynthesis protein